MIKKITCIFSFIFLLFLFAGCQIAEEKTITKIEIINLPEEIEIGTFDECGIMYRIHFSDNTTQNEPVTEETIPDDYKHYLYEEGHHKFNFLYRGVQVSFEATMCYKKYTVTFLNLFDEIVKEIKVKEDETIIYPTEEEMFVEGYRFLSTFDKDITTTNTDVTIKGNYVKVWVVKFYNGFNELISEQIVDEGQNALEPTEEEKKLDGYNFVMWDRSFENITKNINVYGIYQLTEITCNHDIVAATCEKASYCKECGEEFGIALGHDFKITEQVEPTCTTDGYILYTCANECGLTKTQVIISQGHQFNENDICDECGYILPNHTHNYQQTVFNPTCTQMGYTLHECVCGHAYKDNFIEQSRHNWDNGTIVKEATCTVDGEIEYTCIDCEAKLVHKIIAEHNYEITVNQEPTCTVDGEYTKECTKCGDKITETYEAHHEWEEEIIVIKEATCKEDGQAIRKCSVCGEEENYVLDKLGHTYVNGICTNCKESYLDHVVESSHPIYGMYFEIEETLSDYGPEIINEYGVLLDYNEEAIFDKVAVYLTQDGTMWRRTIACTGTNIEYATYVPYLSYGEKIIYTGLNSYYINTFNLRKNSDGIWNYNNYTTIGVNLANNKGDLLLSLADIGQAGKETRLFDNLEEMIAWLKAEDVCYKCDYIKEVIEPTCESEGYDQYTCKVCNHTYKDNYVTKKDHTYQIKENQNATCTQNGYNLYECSLCKKTYHESVKAYGHDIVTDHVEATCTTDGKITTYCQRQGCDYRQETIIKGKHNHVISAQVNPTCTTDGYIIYTCTLCGDSYEEILTTSHNYVETSRTEPKVGVKGSIIYTCTKCSDSYSVELPAIDPINATKSILLIQDNLPWAEDVNRDLLKTLKDKGIIAHYNIISTSSLSNTDLSQYAVVYIANDQSTSMYNRLAQNSEKLETYVSIGGILVYGVCDEGWGGSGSFTGTLPGGVTTNNYYSVYNYIMDNTHPVITGEYTDNLELTNELLKGNYCSHTYFNKSTLLEGTKIILSDGNANPTLIEYTYGEGTVIATGLTWEYFYIRNHYNMNTNYSKYAYEDLLTYAMFISSFEKCEHEYTIEIVEPKCEEQGYTIHTCTKCNYTFKDTYVEALEHIESGWIIDEDSTCEKVGLKHIECTVCHKELAKEEIGYKEHNYQDDVCTECGKDQSFIDLEIFEENGYKYIYFGKFPQTVVDDEILINILSNINATNSLGYIEYNGNEYKKELVDPINLDYTFINGDIIERNKIYFFKVEPIKWRILEEKDGTYKLLSEMILDNREFYHSTEVRLIDGKTIYANNYEYSSIRAWLNGYDGTNYNVDNYTGSGFYNIAFTNQEKVLINTTLVDNSLASTGYTSNPYLCNNTNDKVYLLSRSDMLNEEYGFINDIYSTETRQAIVTDYERSKGYMVTSELHYGQSLWRTRTPYDSDSTCSGRVDTTGIISWVDVAYIYEGIRPAITISVNKSNTCQVTFKDHDGKILKEEIVEKGSYVTAPADPIREGYIFEGWYYNDEKWSGYSVTSDIVLVAKWEPICYKINYQLYGGYYVIDKPIPLEEVKNNFLADCAAHKGVSVEDIKFDTAVNWQGNWNWGAFFATNADNGKNPTYPSVEAPSFWNVPANRERWLWLLEAIYNTMLAYPGGDTYTASLSHIENAIKSNYCSSPQTIAYAFWYFLNGKTHSYFGFNFGDTDGDGIVNSENIIGNFHANPITYAIEDEFILNNPTKEGYIFIGWTSDDLLEPQLNVKIKNQTGDKYFVANYSPIIYTITFDSNGGTEIKDIEYTIESADFTLPIPVRDGYGFLGWYDSKGNKFDKIKKGTFADINLIAKWDNTVYTVTYNLNGGEGAENNPTSYTVLEAPITLINPTKYGYNFLGWYWGDKKVEKLTIGNLELVAKWEPIYYKINYQLDGGYYDTDYPIDLEEVKNNFLADCAAHLGKSVEDIKFDTAANWQSNWSWGAFFATNADNGKNPAYPSVEAPSFWNVPANRGKWLWLLEVIYNTMLVYPGGDTYTSSLSHIENAMKSNYCGSPQTIAYAFWYFLNGQTHSYFGFNFGDTDGDGIVNSENMINKYGCNPLTYTIEDEFILDYPTKEGYIFEGWYDNKGNKIEKIEKGTTGELNLTAVYYFRNTYRIDFVTNKENALWPSRAAYDRFEIYDALYADLYEWAQMNGETKSFEDYKAYIDTQLKAYNDIKLRNVELGNNPAEDGSTEYFLNVPKFYQKWSDFFAIFNEAMLKINVYQNFYEDTYATTVRMYQFMTWSSTGESYFGSYLTKMCAATKILLEIPTTYCGGQIVVLPELYMENGLEFLGWYDNAEFNGEPVTQIVSTDTGDKTFYAKWAEEVKPETIEINKVTKLLLFTTHQLVWSITPDNAIDKSVEFFSSNEEVATVSAKGLITALANGTTTITVKVYGNREIDVVFDLTVYTEDYIDGSYATNSYVEKDDSIQLNAQVVRKDGTTANVLWTSLTPEIATVDANGVVTALKAGEAKIVATDPDNETLTLEFVVVVLEESLDGILELVVESNNSNVFSKYNVNIYDAYSMDIFGSVSKILSNYKLSINDKYYAATQQTAFNGGEMISVEWITVHCTANTAAGADADANARYFSTIEAYESIHYTTGNDGIFYCTDEKYAAFHAGDSGSRAQVGDFKWIATGLEVLANDPATPVITISDDFYYEINGRKTTVKMPNPWNYSSRGTDHILNADGTISSQPAFSQTGFSNRTPESFINDMGLPWKVENGKYYMGTTWWCYTQVYEGRICSSGGNNNSIGIESCVNKGSDLWLTWQMTAKLVADIMVRNNLDITRVKAHRFFNANNDPKLMLENDLEIWKEFLQLVEAEYTMMTEFEGYEVSMKSNNTDIVADNGRVVKQPSETTCVTYTVTITKGEETQTITLASMIKGIYVNR